MPLRKKLWLFALLGAICIFLGCYETQAQAVCDDSLLRFHVIANSDSPFDQQIKLRLRDEIISSVNAITASAHSAEDALILVKEHKEELQAEADAFLEQCGVPYRAEVKIGKSIFPTKSYENITLPAGKYQALKIVLGKGKGKNWWCVLYPSLCFVKINESTSVAYTEQETAEQREIISAAGTPRQTVIRSRLWELLSR